MNKMLHSLCAALCLTVGLLETSSCASPTRSAQNNVLTTPSGAASEPAMPEQTIDINAGNPDSMSR